MLGFGDWRDLSLGLDFAPSQICDSGQVLQALSISLAHRFFFFQENWAALKNYIESNTVPDTIY